MSNVCFRRSRSLNASNRIAIDLNVSHKHVSMQLFHTFELTVYATLNECTRLDGHDVLSAIFNTNTIHVEIQIACVNFSVQLTKICLFIPYCCDIFYITSHFLLVHFAHYPHDNRMYLFQVDDCALGLKNLIVQPVSCPHSSTTGKHKFGFIKWSANLVSCHE